MKKKIAFIIISFFVFNYNSSVAQESTKVREFFKNFNVLLHYGNLTGVGIGINYSISNSFSIDMIAGLAAPGYLIWPAPYRENQINFSFKTKWAYTSILNLNAGIFIGTYDLNQLYDYYYIKKFDSFTEIAPTLSIGFEYPEKIFGNILELEIGLAYNISKKYSRTVKNQFLTYNLEVERSLSSMGNFYPFFMLSVQF